MYSKLQLECNMPIYMILVLDFIILSTFQSLESH